MVAERPFASSTAGAQIPVIRLLAEIDNDVSGLHDAVPSPAGIGHREVRVPDNDARVVPTRLVVDVVDRPVNGTDVELIPSDRQHGSRVSEVLGVELQGCRATE